MLNLLIKVISSWQVIVVTVVVFMYFSLVTFVARTRIHPRYALSKIRKAKKKTDLNTAEASSPRTEEDDINDELGLEE